MLLTILYDSMSGIVPGDYICERTVIVFLRGCHRAPEIEDVHFRLVRFLIGHVWLSSGIFYDRFRM